MATYSQVAGVIEFKTMEDRENFITLVQARNDDLYKMNFSDMADAEWTWDTGKLPHNTEPIMTFNYDSTKWYRHYEDVQAHYKLCEFAEEAFKAEWMIVSVDEEGITTTDYSNNAYEVDLDNYFHVQHTLDVTF
jgi:hypothetical protein